MFQFLRRVSSSFLPRPDRPWKDDATSHAPTIGRKRRYSATERDHCDSMPSLAKRTKKDPADIDSASEAESPKGDAVEAEQVKEVAKGVEEVDLGDNEKVEEDPSSVRPESIPLPESRSGSPEPPSESPEPPTSGVAEETRDKENADDKDASSTSEEDLHETAKVDTSPSTDPVTTVGSGLCDAPGTLEVKA